MNVLVTGVGGQLGHDVMNELYKRGYQGTGSDIQPEYAGMPAHRMEVLSQQCLISPLTSRTGMLS